NTAPLPLVKFAMAIQETDAVSAAIVLGGWIWVSLAANVHLHITIFQRPHALIHENPEIGRGGATCIANMEVFFIDGCPEHAVHRLLLVQRHVAVERCVHGNAAEARAFYRGDQRTSVSVVFAVHTRVGRDIVVGTGIDFYVSNIGAETIVLITLEP